MKLRVSAVQYFLKPISSFAEFVNQSEHYLKIAERSKADFVVFPEFFTTQLMSIPDKDGNGLTINELPNFTEKYVEAFSMFAKSTNMHIVGGTHVVRKGAHLYNVAHLFYPNGQVEKQEKIHITPSEIEKWDMAAGEALNIFETEYGKVAILTCYDIEFPEIVRMAKARGVDIIFCPSCTDNQHGFHRVRYTCHARAIENQVYVVHTGVVGSLPNVDFMRANYGQAAIISPNDIPFPPRGIIAEGELNHDMVVTADLDIELLHQVRASGTVTTWRDRRTDLYNDWN